MFTFLAVKVSTVLLISKYNQTLLFATKVNVSMESSTNENIATQIIIFFLKPFYQLVFWIPVQN